MAFALALIATTVQVASAPAPSQAANAYDFNPGNIISDDVFFNSNSMNEASIQAFLNAMVPNCSPGATCLKNFSQSTYSRGADAMCNAYSGAANEPAARIIYKVAQACGINPQVILVTLQKEQVLVTSSAPSSWAWQASMGYACPDTSACDTQYYGFYNQVYMGSWQLKRYGNPPGTSNYFTWYPVGGYANVLYNPDAGCGSSRVYIANKATAALYYYTPYQPNSAALAAGYGAAPAGSCASYGNRNFFLFFTDWFGSTGTQGPSFIDALYASTGGASGPLGAAVSGYITIADNGGGMVRAYANGAITWARPYGAFVISGPVRDYFNAQGGIAGRLGWPTSALNGVGSGQVQAFQGGAVTLRNGDIRDISGNLRTAYNTVGGLTGPVGWPIGDMSCSSGTCKQQFEQALFSVTSNTSFTITSDKIAAAYKAAGGSGSLGAASGATAANLTAGGGLIQAYANGVITQSASGGAHALSGAIRSQFNNLGGLGGYLGWPTGDMTCDTNKNCSQTFQGGTVYANSDGSSSGMSAAILSLYNSLGGTTGALGAPVGGTSVLAGGLVQGFQKGAITWTAAGGAFALTGDIRAAFNAIGGLSGSFGWPTSAANSFADNGGGLVQGFQNGVILATTSAGAFPMSGPIRTAYNAAGGVPGPVGWPLTSQISTSGGFVQAFQNAAITYTPTAGAHVLSGAFRDAYATTGGIGGSIGWPTSDVVSSAVNGGGQVQGFEKGAVTQKTGGAAIVLSGPIRDYFNGNGGLAGALGWPARGQVCTPDGSACQQTFDGGTVTWTKSAGASLAK